MSRILLLAFAFFLRLALFELVLCDEFGAVVVILVYLKLVRNGPLARTRCRGMVERLAGSRIALRSSV